MKNNRFNQTTPERLDGHQPSTLNYQLGSAPLINANQLSDFQFRLLCACALLKHRGRRPLHVSFPDEDQEYLKITQTAIRLRTTERNLRRWMKAGRVPFLRVGGR